MTFADVLHFELLKTEQVTVTFQTILIIACILVAVRLLLFFIKKAMLSGKKNDEGHVGDAYALFQIIKYVVWIIAISLILESIGVSITVLVAGSAALLVGVGLGLQQTFNDIVSGIILLSERSIRYGDILEIDGDVVKMEAVGLRTSKCLNRDGISIIIPNSLITTNKVINWSHQSTTTRFRIDVGVAYGSDVDVVTKALTESALEHPEITDSSQVEVRLVGFNNSSVDFQLLFLSNNIFRVEKVKSDIRRTINSKFKAYKITIPFPQIDVHMK